MERLDLLLAAIPALAIGLPAIWWLRPRHDAVPLDTIEPGRPNTQGWPAQALPVLEADDLIAHAGVAPLLTDIRRMSGLTDATWDNHIEPVIQGVARMVQQLPASESHHHAQPGGLFLHTVETLGYAARLRLGRILPLSTDIETQSRVQHLWTVGLYIGALLHDIGKTATDVRVTVYAEATPSGMAWQALLGSMHEAHASAYVVAFPNPAERDYRAHQTLGIQFLPRLVAPATRLWLGSDPVLLEQLLGYLGGNTQGPIAEMIREAETESVRRNLASGTRVRFASARAEPLIELLMRAMRALLAEGGRLPLNRPGAAGFCDGEDIWFAAVRLANEVRDWVRMHHPEAPIPGDTMNDRLFDTWQEYGACRSHPSSHGAIWSARIEFNGGQRIQLNALLRFPLELLYPGQSLYPKALDGRIVVAQPDAGEARGMDVHLDTSRASSTGTQAEGAPSSPTPSKGEALPRPRLTEVTKRASTQRASEPDPAVVDATPAESMVGREADTQILESPSDFLSEDDSAIGLMTARRGQATSALPPRHAGAVVPHVALPVGDFSKGKLGKAVATPSDAALRFMGWLQQGLADGSLPYNTASALVHFVKVNLREREETMMLLVSPAVFRKFAEAYGDDAAGREDPAEATPGKLGMGIQMAFSQAGWHQPATRGRNIHRFQVIRRGESGGSLLNGFLVREPERFVNPVPPPNEHLRYWGQNVSPGHDKAAPA